MQEAPKRLPCTLYATTVIIFEKRGAQSFTLTNEKHVKYIKQFKKNRAKLRLKTCSLPDNKASLFRDMITAELKEVPGVSDASTVVLRLLTSRDATYLADYLSPKKKRESQFE